jgi:hypothetical protein
MRRLILWTIARGFGRGSGLTGVRYLSRGWTSVALPVQGAHQGSRVDVAVASASRKTWWRHFRQPAPLEVLLDGRWRAATAIVASGAAEGAARRRYLVRFPDARLDADTRMVTISLDD